jgi:hypothetical protein
MSDLERYAALKGKTERTVRRWCVEGKVPTAYRNSSHWYISPLLVQREENLKWFRERFGDGSKRDKYALMCTLVAYNIHDSRDAAALLRREPEQFRFLYRDYEQHPNAREIMSDQSKALVVIAKWLHLNGRDVTRQTLAEALGVSRRTLYRDYGADKLRELCPIRRRRKPKIDSGNLYDLAA